MNVMVVGMGSIGTRRARELALLGCHVYTYDPVNYDAEPQWVPVGTREYRWRVGQMDAMVVCTPPDPSRVTQTLQAWAEGVALYMEKPVGLDLHTVEAVERLAHEIEAYGVTTMGACNLRFDKRVEEIKHTPHQYRHATAIMGQAHHHWSPNHKPIAMALDSIHELDLVTHLLGELYQVTGWSTDDMASMVTYHTMGGQGGVTLDRHTDPPVRLVTVDHGGAVSLWPPDPDMYHREMAHFVERVKEKRRTTNPLSEACRLNRLVLEGLDK